MITLTSLLPEDFGEHDDPISAPGFDPDPTPLRAPAPTRQPAVQPMGSPAPITESDLRVMIGEARRDVRKQSGLVGQVMNRLRGDDLQRRQYATMLRRIDAWDATEEAKLAAFLITSLNVLGFQVTVAALAEMEKYLGSFHPESAAARAGGRMLAHQERYLPETIETLMQRAHRGATRPFGLDR